MATVKKIKIVDSQGTDVSYDIGALAQNIVYDNNNSVKDKIDDYEDIIPSSASSSNQLLTENDLPIATDEQVGLVKPDGTTITIDENGTLTAIGGGGGGSVTTRDYAYTGTIQTFTAPETGTYTLEVQGGQGGTPIGGVHGGYGGYSVGKINLNQDDTIYICVGGEGGNSSSDPAAYNGGGLAYFGDMRGNGGGATHIATATGELADLASNQTAVIIVAGGGGGAGNYAGTDQGDGGSGGGYIGGHGLFVGSTTGDENSHTGSGGTQSAGGATENYSTQSTGSFGQGASTDNGDLWGGSGGGGGQYGGGASTNNAGAGGGSGYLNTSVLTDACMYGYNVQASSETATKTMSVLAYNSIPTPLMAKAGSGYARVSQTSGSQNVFVTQEEFSERLENTGYDVVSDTQIVLKKEMENCVLKAGTPISQNTGYNNIYGYSVQKLKDNIYYSNQGNNYIFDKSTSTWSNKTQNGLTSFSGSNIQVVNEKAYYSNGTDQYELNEETSTQSEKTQSGLTNFYGRDIQMTNSGTVYYSDGSTQYELDLETSTWSEKTQNGLTNFSGDSVWLAKNHIYYNSSIVSYELNINTSTQVEKTWDGVSSFDGQYIWTDGKYFYCSELGVISNGHYIIDIENSKCTYLGKIPYIGSYVWTDGNKYYASCGNEEQYELLPIDTYDLNLPQNYYSKITGTSRPSYLINTNLKIDPSNLKAFDTIYLTADTTDIDADGSSGLEPTTCAILSTVNETTYQIRLQILNNAGTNWIDCSHVRLPRNGRMILSGFYKDYQDHYYAHVMQYDNNGIFALRKKIDQNTPTSMTFSDPRISVNSLIDVYSTDGYSFYPVKIENIFIQGNNAQLNLAEEPFEHAIEIIIKVSNLLGPSPYTS